MAKLESSFKNMVIVLTSIALFAALALGSVYTLTKEPIEAAKKAKQENAIKEVLPAGFDRIEEGVEVKLDGFAETFTVYKAFKADAFLGAAVQSYSTNAFSGLIRVMVGFTATGEVVTYSVLEQKETPGLGTKMVDWFKTEKGKQNIQGKNLGLDNVTVTKDGGDIDAITAATISSRAFLESVRLAFDAFNKTNNKDAVTAATQMGEENNNE